MNRPLIVVKRPYEVGYRVAAKEIEDGIASNTRAIDRGLYPDSSLSRSGWDQGYVACICAYRLGYDPFDLIELERYVAAPVEVEIVAIGLMDGTWPFPLRPDPRR